MHLTVHSWEYSACLDFSWNNRFSGLAFFCAVYLRLENSAGWMQVWRKWPIISIQIIEENIELMKSVCLKKYETAMVQKVVLFLEPSNFCCCLCPLFETSSSLSYFYNISSWSSLSLIFYRSFWTGSSLLIFKFKDSLQRLWLMELGFLTCSNDNIDIHVPQQQTSRGIYYWNCHKLNIP